MTLRVPSPRPASCLENRMVVRRMATSHPVLILRIQTFLRATAAVAPRLTVCLWADCVTVRV